MEIGFEKQRLLKTSFIEVFISKTEDNINVELEFKILSSEPIHAWIRGISEELDLQTLKDENNKWKILLPIDDKCVTPVFTGFSLDVFIFLYPDGPHVQFFGCLAVI